MASTARGGDVDWLPWGSEAFARARAERKPILLSIAAPWSSACREMDRSSYAEPAVVAAIRAGFVAVSVDADHRPDIADRYDLGGLPSTCFLSAAGGLLGGGTFVPPDRLILALARVADASREQTPNEPATLAHSGGVNQLDADPASELPLTDAELATLVFSSFDERHAGFGGAPKFPLTAPVRLALDLYTSHQDARMLDRAVRTLDAIGWGPLYDEEDGGFFRCAARADWTEPEPEKLLAPNAALLDLYVHAGTVLGHERWFARAVDVAQYINRAMAAANGAWLLSACADPARQFSDANAATASAMLHAAAVFQDEALGRRALNALERVLLSSYKPGDGVAHSAAGIRGLLTDQVAMAAANLDAWDSTGNIVYRMMAEELAHYALRTMWDETGGGFFDRAADAAARDPLPGVPLKPFVLNCDAAMMLRRLADAVDDPGFAARARETLAAVAGRAPEFSALAAHYLLARRVVLR